MHNFFYQKAVYFFANQSIAVKTIFGFTIIFYINPLVHAMHPPIEKRLQELSDSGRKVKCYSNACGGNIPNNSILGGNFFRDGTFPDVIINKSHPVLNSFLNEIDQLVDIHTDYFTLVNEIQNNIQEKIKHFDYGSDTREQNTLDCGNKNMKGSQESAPPCELGKLLEAGSGDCRVHNMLLHLALERASISSEYVYAEVESNIPRMSWFDKQGVLTFKNDSGKGIFSEDHAMVRIKHPETGEAIILDSYFPYFNGVKEADILKGTNDPKRIPGIINNHEKNTPKDESLTSPGIEYFKKQLLSAQKEKLLIPELQNKTSDELLEVATNEYYRRDTPGIGGYRKINKYLGFPQVIVDSGDDEIVKCFQNKIIYALQLKKPRGNLSPLAYFKGQEKPDICQKSNLVAIEQLTTNNLEIIKKFRDKNQPNYDELLKTAKNLYEKSRSENLCTAICGMCGATVPTTNEQFANKKGYPTFYTEMSDATTLAQNNKNELCESNPDKFVKNFEQALKPFILKEGKDELQFDLFNILLNDKDQKDLTGLISSLSECR